MSITDYYIAKQRETSSLFDPNNKLLLDHIDKWNNLNTGLIIKPGQIILFESFHGEKSRIDNTDIMIIDKPSVGIFYDYDIWDQALVLKWFPYPRIKYTNLVIRRKIDNEDFKTLSQIDWGNDFPIIYGVWDSLPSWQELRDYYYKTWTYSKSREEIIDDVLK